MAANPIVPNPELEFQTEKGPEEIVVRCTGRVTSSTSAEFGNTIRGLLPGVRRMILDLGNVPYMDSSGLGALVGVWTSAKRAGCELKVVNLNKQLKDLFRVTNLGLIFGGSDEYLDAAD